MGRMRGVGALFAVVFQLLGRALVRPNLWEAPYRGEKCWAGDRGRSIAQQRPSNNDLVAGAPHRDKLQLRL